MKSKIAGGDPNKTADIGAVAREGGFGHVANLEASTLDALGQRLRQNYQQIIEEGVPPKFLDLLERLKTNGTSKDDSGA